MESIFTVVPKFWVSLLKVLAVLPYTVLPWHRGRWMCWSGKLSVGPFTSSKPGKIPALKNLIFSSLSWAKSVGTDIKNCEALCDGAVLGDCYSLLLVRSDGHLLGKEISAVVFKAETQDGDKQWFTKLWTLLKIHVISGGVGWWKVSEGSGESLASRGVVGWSRFHSRGQE